MRKMTEQLIEMRRDAFVVLAERELIEFERKERELRKQERLERAKTMFPTLMNHLQS